MDPVARRQFLLLLSALGSCAFAYSGAIAPMAGAALADPAQALPLDDIRQAAGRLAGREDLRETVSEIRRILAEASSLEAATARLAERSRADFSEGKLTSLEGWRLSYTDASIILVLVDL